MRRQLDALITQIDALEKERPRAAESSTSNDAEAIAQKLSELIDKRLKAPVPIEHAVWSTKEIGEYLLRPAQVVRESIVCLPGFPEAIRLPGTDGAGRSRPRWKAAEVIEWVESHQTGRIGRPRKKG